MLTTTSEMLYFADNLQPRELLTILGQVEQLKSSKLYSELLQLQASVTASLDKEQLDKQIAENDLNIEYNIFRLQTAQEALEHSKNEARDTAEYEQYLQSLQAILVEKRRQAIRNHKAAARIIRQERRHYMCDGSQALSRTYQAVKKPILPHQTNTLCQIPYFKSIFDELGTRRALFLSINQNTLLVSAFRHHFSNFRPH
jgi:hypothetical protein